MLIILEGPDGSGKSTLCKSLCENLNFKNVVPPIRTIGNQYNIWYNLIYGLCISDEYYVMDRCFLSELIYRSIKKDFSANISFTDISELLKLFGSNSRLHLVFCENNNAYNFAMNRGEDYVTNKGQHQDITNAYKFLKNVLTVFTTISIITYDFEKDNVDKIRRLLNE